MRSAKNKERFIRSFFIGFGQYSDLPFLPRGEYVRLPENLDNGFADVSAEKNHRKKGSIFLKIVLLTENIKSPAGVTNVKAKLMHCFFIVMLCFLQACDNGAGKSSESEQPEQAAAAENRQDGTALRNETVTDCYGRKIRIPAEIKRAVCVGSGALRMLMYLQAENLLAGTESTDLNYAEDPKRDYAYVFHEKLKSLPVVGKGGGSSYTAYPEALLEVKPDVIFSGYTKEGTEQLAKETGIPVIGVRYESKNFVDESFYSSLRLMADVLGREKRAEELLAVIDACRADLQKRTQGVRTEKSVYVGAVSYNGSHGFSGTYSKFGPFTAISARNAADSAEREGFYEVDLEQVLVWNPDIIFLDPTNGHITEQEYAARSAYFDRLSAVQAGEVYSMPSFNNYSTNIAYCLINGYWAGSIIFPERFEDINLAQKADEILEIFLGKAYFADMRELGLPYEKLSFGRAKQ